MKRTKSGSAIAVGSLVLCRRDLESVRLRLTKPLPAGTEIKVIAFDNTCSSVRLNIIARDMAHYQAIYRQRILTLPHIADIEALMQIAQIKAEEALPL